MVMMMNGSHKLCVCKSDVSNLKAKGLKEKQKNPALHHTYFGILLPTPPPPPPRSKQEGQRGEGDGFFWGGCAVEPYSAPLPPIPISHFLDAELRAGVSQLHKTCLKSHWFLHVSKPLFRINE